MCHYKIRDADETVQDPIIILVYTVVFPLMRHLTLYTMLSMSCRMYCNAEGEGFVRGHVEGAADTVWPRTRSSSVPATALGS